MRLADCCDMDVAPEPAAAKRTRLQSLAEGPQPGRMQSVAVVTDDVGLHRQSSPDVHGPGLCILLSTYLL